MTSTFLASESATPTDSNDTPTIHTLEFLDATISPSFSPTNVALSSDATYQSVPNDTQDNCNSVSPHIVFRGAKDIFSNFFPVPAGINALGRLWPTVEHAYQAMKAAFLDHPWLIPIIRRTSDPILVKRRVSYELYDCDPDLVHEWNKVRVKFMESFLQSKLSALPCLKDTLLNSKGIIVEGTTDLFWGSGHSAKQTALKHHSSWHGQNTLGQLWMKLRRQLQMNVTAPSVQCFPVFPSTLPNNAETCFPDEDYYFSSLFRTDPVAAAGFNQPDIQQLFDGDHSHDTPSLKSASPGRNLLQPAPRGDRPVPKPRLSRATIKPAPIPLQLIPDEPKLDQVVQDTQNRQPQPVSSEPPPASTSKPILLPNPAQDLILPDVHNLIGDQEPDSSFVHRYNL